MNDLPDEAKSREHVFPDSLGGALQLHDLCKPCNDTWGRVVDAPLVDHLLCQIRRLEHGIEGKDGHVPNPFARAVLSDDPTQRVVTGIGETKPPAFLPGSKTRRLENGREQKIFHGDRADEAEIQAAAARFTERARQKGLAVEEVPAVIVRHEQPMFTSRLKGDTFGWRAGAVKIAYELAYLELGRHYLDDPVAVDLRRRLKAPEATLDQFVGIVGMFGTGQGPGFPLPPTWHQGLILEKDDYIVVIAQVFDILHCAVRVTERREPYPLFNGYATHLLDAKRRRCHRLADDQFLPKDLEQDLLAAAGPAGGAGPGEGG